MNAIKSSTLTLTQRMLLICMADIASDGGECWASQATLASAVGVTDRAIRTALAALEEIGVIEQNGTGFKGAIRWVVRLDRIPTRNDVPGSEDRSGTTFRPIRNDVPSTPERRSDNPPHDPPHRPEEPSPLPPTPAGRGALSPASAWWRDELLGDLLAIDDAKAAEAYAELLEHPTADLLDRLQMWARGEIVTVRDFGTNAIVQRGRKRPRPGMPTTRRGRTIERGAQAAALTWRTEVRGLARDLTLKGHESTGPPSTGDPDDPDLG